ncbi:MAG: Holliday junction branch migration protein RuvA [Balneolaceae bacterium]
MIAFLEGALDAKQEGFALINVQGIGYRVAISMQTFESLPSEGQSLRLSIYHHITDSDQRLFGFISTREQTLFEHLITVKGVGPKLGLTILSGMKPAQLVSAIVDQDIQALSRIPGIGKKSAERIILELKDKILTGKDHEPVDRTAAAPRIEEALSALGALGFKKREAEKLVMEITRESEQITVSEIVKLALQKQGT